MPASNAVKKAINKKVHVRFISVMGKFRKIVPVLLILSLAFFFSCNFSTINSNDPIVRLSTGIKITGIEKKGVNNFRGIPYGENTALENRFSPPKLCTLNEDFNAKNFGDISPQKTTSKKYKMSENCLNLNVQTPKGTKKGDKLPVYVWIHGGWFMFGNGNQYDGRSFVENGIVFVSINYRLNLF
ncbi:MAG: carboxylesterase family protein, partial [Clostridiales Family XIII bacterium]|nr:carboxylesterase family protein [Clostridiales Family XIII bacterium]